jgi:2-polyprenyl-3-methyl-5-hydroxy-6-metoxy-1,4-benzoquinol methylase
MEESFTKLSYTPFERIKIARPVDRIAYIKKACENKAVLDLGAMDETAFFKKRGKGSWLHEEIAKVAAQVVGLDSSEIVPEDGLATADNAIIYRGNILELADFIDRIGRIPEVIVAGEIIEHLANPLVFLKSFKDLSILKGGELLLSTPNATALHNCLIAFSNCESTHPDHLCILSFKTISTLLSRAGYNSWTIVPYYSDFIEMKERNVGMRRSAVVIGEKIVNVFERTFPLLSFGFIVKTVI